MLCLTLALAGCVGRGPTTPKSQTATQNKPLAVQPADAVVGLTGKVKLVATGIVSDNGGGVISNNTGNLIGNNGSAIIGDNGAGLVANNAGSIVGKTKYGLAQARAARELLLADAVIAVEDAGGKPVLGADGKPLTARTDATGSYKLEAALPARNLVLRIKLHEGGALQGGDLLAMLPRATGKREQSIDTATSLGAAYVLGKFVKGDQQVFDKLPADEAERLRAELEAARALAAPPRYQPEALVAATEELRGKAPAVGKALSDIQALLLGQAGGGDGQQATRAALFDPTGLALGANGELIVGEPGFGRIRQIGLDGTISTLADILRGKLRRNFPDLGDLLRAPDGSLYIAVDPVLFRITPDFKEAQELIGGDSGHEGAPYRLARGADGTLYVGEQAYGDADPAPRVLALGSDGQPKALDLHGAIQGRGTIIGLAATADGGLDILIQDAKANLDTLWHRTAAGEMQKVSEAPQQGQDAEGYLAVGPDGTRYISNPGFARVEALGADGKRRVIAGKDGPQSTRDLVRPGTLHLQADGTLLIADEGANVVRALGPDGSWTIRAGTTAVSADLGDLRSLALNAPSGAVFDAAGGLVVAEKAANRIVRYADGKIAVLAGGLQGFAGDGGPATEARMDSPYGLAERDGTIYVLDSNNDCIRSITPDGLMHTVAGNANRGLPDRLEPGQRLAPDGLRINGRGVAVAPDGRLYLGTASHQVMRIGLDGNLELVAGKWHDNKFDGAFDALASLGGGTGDGGPAAEASFGTLAGMAFDGKGDLYVADLGDLRIRRITGLDGPNPTIQAFAGRPLFESISRLEELRDRPNGVKAADAVLGVPMGLCFDAAGNLYVGEIGTRSLPLLTTMTGSVISFAKEGVPQVSPRISRIAPDGTLTTLAGPGGKYFTQDEAEDALVLPLGLAFGQDGRLAIVDGGANLIRILPAGKF